MSSTSTLLHSLVFFENKIVCMAYCSIICCALLYTDDFMHAEYLHSVQYGTFAYCVLCTYYSIDCRNSMSSIVVWHSQHVSDSITPIHLNTLMYTRLHYFNTTLIYFHTLNLATTSPRYHKINTLTGISLHNICTQKDIFNTVVIPQPNYFLIVLSISNLSNFKIHFKDVWILLQWY